MYKKDLEKEMKGETSGDFAKLVVALLHVISELISFTLTIKLMEKKQLALTLSGNNRGHCSLSFHDI